MAQDMTDDCPDRLSSRCQTPISGIELPPRAARAGENANRLKIVCRYVGHVRLTGPAGRTNDPTGSKAKRYHRRLSLDQGAAGGAQFKRRHQSQLAQASQLKPNDPLLPQVCFAQMPQGDSRRVEQPGMRIVQVSQIGQQFGDIVAGIQGTKIATKTCEAFDRHGLGQQVEGLGRFGKEHDIGNT
jgi:hypothetical protein